ncbi:Rhamnogalacturonate lyase, partial [Linum grandiflorum]
SKKNELTCHCGPTCVLIFTSIHTYGLDLTTEYRNGEPWKKVFGPVFIYLNSNGDRATLWKDAKMQLEKEKRMWPYSFVQHPDYLPASQRGAVFGQLLVNDKYLSPTPKEGCRAWVGLAMPGTTDDAWQLEIKGYNFWTEADEKGNFMIKNVRPGDYNLYGYVPGVVGSFRHCQLITVKPGDVIKLGRVTFTPPRSGPTIWEIGVPDRSANEFFVPDPDPKFVNTFWLDKPKDKYRQYGLWERYAELYPKEDLVYEVGVSKYDKDWFFEHVLRWDGKTYIPAVWKVVFDLPEVVPGNYAIQMALAEAQTTNTFVYINDPNARRAHFATGTVGTDNAIARHGNHGMYRFFNGTLPSTLFVKGRNTMYIRPAKSTSYAFAGVMYDYIRLEAPPTAGLPLPKEL